MRPDHLTPLAVDASGAAALVCMSRSGWLKARSRGLVPEPVRIARRVLWSVDELRAWLAAGAPNADRWREMKASEAGGPL